MTIKFKTAIAALFLCFGFATTAYAQEFSGRYWQCVTFAREFSGVQLFGNAWSWWDQAAGRYDRGSEPKIGAVLVMRATGGMPSGHVATVTNVIDNRTVTVTHANWSVINGHRGQIERDVPVVDVSDNNDWSAVRVWYAPIGKVGNRSYPAYGFVYADGAPQQGNPRLQYASLGTK